MKTVLFCVISLVGLNLQAQTWTTLNTVQMGNAQANPGFKLDVYRNDLWYYASTNQYKVSCFHLNDGSIDLIDLYNPQVITADYDVAFTPASRFLMSFGSGLYKINADYSLTNKYFANYNSDIFQNGDTIYMALYGPEYLAYTENGSITHQKSFRNVCAKGSILYPSFFINGSLQKYTGVSTDGYEDYSSIDNEYLCGQFNDIKFSPYTDTVYVACAAGISIGYNYDFVDSITPDNTTNMPSANVLEFEFDLENRIWACFADTNGDAFAIARLDGDTWTNYYDVNNSPITFGTYKGMEIDTTGNLWVAATSKTYLLDLGETPLWLATSELKEEQISLSPNPALEACELAFPNSEKRSISIVTIEGQLLQTYISQTNLFTIDFKNLAKGNYLMVIESENEKTVKKFVKL